MGYEIREVARSYRDLQPGLDFTVNEMGRFQKVWSKEAKDLDFILK